MHQYKKKHSNIAIHLNTNFEGLMEDSLMSNKLNIVESKNF